MTKFAELWTQAGKNLSGQPWQEYPRPTMRRDSYLNLNGAWEFTTGRGKNIPQVFDQTIRVPFPPESLLSGIHQVYGRKQTRFYRKIFTLPRDFLRARVLLHFGAVDQKCRVYLNDRDFGSHAGGYNGFSFDITDALQTENTLIIAVEDDPKSIVLPYGKQRHKRGGMWYTPVSGIWQTVWLESVPREYIRKIRIQTRKNRVSVCLEGIESGILHWQAGDISVSGGKAEFDVESPRYWCPEDPYLYPFTVEAGEDRVESYFALRDLEIRTVDGLSRLCLNGRPYFFHGVLDQGYWSDGLLTPASPQCLEEDILTAKSLGLNMLRKHIKVEPELFYYACDRLGMVVFQDFVNNGNYRYVLDTVLPTIGFQTRRSDRHMHWNAPARTAFQRGMEQTVDFLQNHPCVCCWTIFNEGWGQFCSQAMYEKLKKLDGSRFVDTTSGWFRCGESDVESLHIYFRPVKITPGEKPVVLSEYGGFVMKLPEHAYNLKKTYGYKFFDDPEEFMDTLEKLYREEVLPAVSQGLCADVYTQLSDVEDETNGLVTYDRQVVKVDREKMQAIGKDLQKAIQTGAAEAAE